jgi:hypothetical protein
MLALERKAVAQEGDSVRIWAQPFGGAVRILDPDPLEKVVGDLQYDSERSKLEMDFRILIPPAKWENLKGYCCLALADPENSELESFPHRELSEEFEESMGVLLGQRQYTARPLGFVIEDHPTLTGNTRAHGMPTVRLYRVFDVQIVDETLSELMLASSERYSDEALGMLARQDRKDNGPGKVHSVLVLPRQAVLDSWLARPYDLRYRSIRIQDHELDETVLAILDGIDVPQYQRMQAA